MGEAPRVWRTAARLGGASVPAEQGGGEGWYGWRCGRAGGTGGANMCRPQRRGRGDAQRMRHEPKFPAPIPPLVHSARIIKPLTIGVQVLPCLILVNRTLRFRDHSAPSIYRPRRGLPLHYQPSKGNGRMLQ